MRVLTSASGTVTHLDGREHVAKYVDAPDAVVRAEGPACNGVGASRGNVRWSEREAKAVTCKSCLRILAGQHAEAITENEIRTLKADARADLAEVLAEVATEAAPKPAARRPVTEADMVVGVVVFKGNGKTAYRVYAVRTVEVYGGGTALRAGLVKTTTKSDPSRSTWWAASELTTEQTGAERMAEAETEARAMHAQHMMTPEGQAQEDTLAARRAEPCGQCGSERSNPRHHSAEGHAFVEAAEIAEEDERSGMHVELSSGLTEFVEPGHRLQHKDSGTLATVTAVGPNALDLRTDDGTHRSGASWYWGRPSVAELSEVGPIDRQAVLSTRVESLLDSGVPQDEAACTVLGVHGPHPWYAGLSSKSRTRCPGRRLDPNLSTLRIFTPSGEAATVLGSGTQGGRSGVWAVREGNDPTWGVFFVDQEHLTLQFSAYRPGERARLADAARVLSRLAEPGQVAELARSIAERAEAFAGGTVPPWGHEAFRLRMEADAATLASWLGMSAPVRLASYPSPYGGTDTVAEAWQARAGVQARLCRSASSRWTTYGATCNTPVAEDGTCPEVRLHV